MISAIVTIPPYAPFIRDVAAHPIVEGVRVNTVMPTKGSLEVLLRSIQDKVVGKDVWVDLKCRQLRVADYGVPPFTEITLTHNLTVNTPVTAYFKDGEERAKVLEVDGNRLIMQEGPKRVIGPGESVNIPDPSLSVDGYFTDTDKKFIEAGKKAGIKNYMLSFVESPCDIQQFKDLYPEANIVAKIESQKGMHYIENQWNDEARLMAARGDLYVEVPRPHLIIPTVESIVAVDPKAIVASRILPSLATSHEPTCQDISDVDNLIRMGYKTFMLGDDVAMQYESVMGALNLLEQIGKQHEKMVDKYAA